IGGQGGFTGTGQAEEQAHITVFTDVGRAVHRQHVFFRQQEVLHAEHGFLHFTGVAHACQQHFALGKVQNDGAVRTGDIAFRYAFKARYVEDGPLFFGRRVVGFRQDKQVTAEQVLPGSLGNHFYRQVMLRVSTHVHVRYEAVVLGQVLFHAIPERIEFVGIERAVDVAPVDGVFAAWLFNDETVHRRTAGTHTGFNNQCAVVLQSAFATQDGLFYQE